MDNIWPAATEWPLGRRICYAREKAKRTQSWLAEQLGISRNAISIWETSDGDAGPKQSNLRQLPALLGCPAEWLFTGSNARSLRGGESETLHTYQVGAEASRHAAEFQKMLDADPAMAKKFTELLEMMVGQLKREQRTGRKDKAKGDRPNA